MINYVKGDATRPIGEGAKILVHVCNDIGVWGKGFVVAISQRWKAPEAAYRSWHRVKDGFELGQVQFVKVEQDLWVANLIGQTGIRSSKTSLPPIRYPAIASGLEMVAKEAQKCNATVHMPRIGCGLAGGVWTQIEPLIQEKLVEQGLTVTVYDL